MDVDHLTMGCFYCCRFEILKFKDKPTHKQELNKIPGILGGKRREFSHSATKFRASLNGIGRIYRTYVKSKILHNFYEGEVQNGAPHGFGRQITASGE